MQAVRLHGPRDLRVEQIPQPTTPGPGMALLRITAVGVCGSDVHTYQDARIGDTVVATPLTLGHEFAGVVVDVGSDSYDGNFAPLLPGTRVAVDPAHAASCANKGTPISASSCIFAAPTPMPAA